ncbi:MAG: hypothetical protein Q7U98_01295 [Methylicorpusculum sp.]|uniref:COG3904 family protein n=1 Tax=Methylicorpusculum sp. TaxID=2713644 RepID=UPI00272764F7|nr:hypothetical protein [Methylicorpusculum sp.]MDO8937773.1 hypothetical protein [Methylicorpusculum sp.]MDP2200571.1 hypothetical protein [Methylicorpusculum sp.]
MKHLFIFLLIALISISSAIADDETEVYVLKAGHISEIVSGSMPEIYINGPINDTTIAKFVATITVQQIKTGTVYLNSSGGNLISGIDLGRIIRKSGFSTNVGVKGNKYGNAKPGGCYSACVLAYIGGYYRFSNSSSRIGVHRFSTDTPNKADLDVAQIVSAAITGYLKESGVDVALFNRMSQAGKDEVYLLSAQESESLGVVNNGIRPSTWTLQSEEEIMYLKGEQETLLGIGKILLTCIKGSLVAAAFYEAGENAPLIAESTGRYSLRINESFNPIRSLIRPVKVSNEYVSAYFQPTPDQTKKLLSAYSIGFAFHPPNPDIFYGFQIDARDSHQQILNYIKYCNLQRSP